MVRFIVKDRFGMMDALECACVKMERLVIIDVVRGWYINYKVIKVINLIMFLFIFL